jgi:hypothetical protein
MVTLANIAVLILIGMVIRTEIMYYKSIMLLDAIYKYRIYCIKHWEKPNVELDDVMRFKDLVLNLAKWRYTDIISKEKFEIIKPYMK